MPAKKKNIEELMAEADELLHQINSQVSDDLEERQRLQLEKHAQNVDKIKSDLKTGPDPAKSEAFKLTDSAEGMHEAMEDIVRAMKEMKNKLFGKSRTGD